ncbi:MAG: GTP-binding protein [Candidatus Thorarchaeota archaeon]|jgi:small GTP-binding protein|nr:GTP-binding protein [Candidatus Thorarchaeota archaeon]
MAQSNDTTAAASDDGFEGYKFRIVLLGEAAVGKTSLVRRYTENVFDEEYKQTIGTTFATKDIDVTDGEGNVRTVRLNIWDMGGQSTYRELRRQFMKGASGAVIVYDVTRPETFMAMNNWFESFKEVCPDSPVIISANKVDLSENRMVPQEPGMMLRDWFQAEYFETSAKTGDKVNNVFTRVAEVVLEKALSESKSPLM